MCKILVITLVALSLLSFPGCAQSNADQTAASADSVYTTKPSSNGGTGKFYMGREIAQVMGHLGAEWLERPEREQEERTDLLIGALDLPSTAIVADIGAGTGYFSFRLAKALPKGQVLAVDIQPEMITLLEENKRKTGIRNVKPILGTISNPKLPESKVDLVLIVDAYHEFSHPREMMQQISQALKPNGRLALVEYRAEDPDVPIRPLHKMSQEQARKEMAAIGLKFLQTKDLLPRQHLMIFGKE